MVKFPGARGGRGYFVASSTEEFDAKIEAMKARGWLEDSDVEAHTLKNTFQDVTTVYTISTPHLMIPLN
jgi:5-formaminoimidazole-4-carboxamide-1-beta-D-ribofuranosyl 5'-monophosphate synthetase